MNPLSAGVTALLALCVMVLPRPYMAVPILASACYIPLAQTIMVGPLDFGAVRILISVGWLRLLLRKEVDGFEVNRLDVAILLYALSATLTHTILVGTVGALVNRLGLVYNALGLYFLFRLSVRTHDEIAFTIRSLIPLIVPLAAGMLVEYATGRNLFSVFGGVGDVSAIRYGRVRCQGPFAHPILAGTVGASVLPLIVSQLWHSTQARRAAWIGVAACACIVITSGSSGALLTLLGAAVGLSFWWFRPYLRAARWGLVLGVIALAVVMKAPVWFVIARISSLTGGTGWHRSYLIDRAVHYFDEWWALGTTYTAHWMPNALPSNPDMADITNNYIYEGVNGGLLSMLLFIFILVRGFQAVGIGMRNAAQCPFAHHVLIWSLGASLLAHAMAMMSVAYFDQIVVFWYLLLAMVANACLSRLGLACETDTDMPAETPNTMQPIEPCRVA
ncbi:MAG: hypothetical protein GF331_26905 [Chitinivibrionales bacterium]|nr:hypothetical protein [Chitinivibrionales bacterium]